MSEFARLSYSYCNLIFKCYDNCKIVKKKQVKRIKNILEFARLRKFCNYPNLIFKC